MIWMDGQARKSECGGWRGSGAVHRVQSCPKKKLQSVVPGQACAQPREQMEDKELGAVKKACREQLWSSLSRLKVVIMGC